MEEKYKDAIWRVMVGTKFPAWEDRDDCLFMISPNDAAVFFTITYTSHGYYLKALDGNELKLGMLLKGMEIKMLPVIMGFLIGLYPIDKTVENIKDISELKHGDSLGNGSHVVGLGDQYQYDDDLILRKR